MSGGEQEERWDFEDRDWELDDAEWSHKAWMSVTDADLVEALLLERAGAVSDLKVLEWGSGRSTLYYTTFLIERGIAFRWLSLEYDRGYFAEALGPELDRLPHSVYLVSDEEATRLRLKAVREREQLVELVVFDKGRLRPMLRSFAEDREADLDAYVLFPGRQGRQFDVVLVDGRKRRRCLGEAAKVLADEGIVLLHDAWRPYYRCGFRHYRAGRTAGDILWVGSQGTPEELEATLVALGA